MTNKPDNLNDPLGSFYQAGLSGRNEVLKTRAGEFLSPKAAEIEKEQARKEGYRAGLEDGRVMEAANCKDSIIDCHKEYADKAIEYHDAISIRRRGEDPSPTEE